MISQLSLYIHIHLDGAHLWSTWDKCVEQQKYCAKWQPQQSYIYVYLYTIQSCEIPRITAKNTFMEIVRVHAVSACWTPSLIVYTETEIYLFLKKENDNKSKNGMSVFVRCVCSGAYGSISTLSPSITLSLSILLSANNVYITYYVFNLIWN